MPNSTAPDPGINFIPSYRRDVSVPPLAGNCSRTETFIGRWLEGQPRDQVVRLTQGGGAVAGHALDSRWSQELGSSQHPRAALEGS